MEKLIVFIIVILISFTSLKAQVDQEQLQLIKKTGVGEKIMSTFLENSKGELVSSNILFSPGKTTYLYFWASDDKTGLQEIVKIEARKPMLPRNINIVYISIDEEKKIWEKISKELHLNQNSYHINLNDTILLPLTLKLMNFDGVQMVSTVYPIVSKIDENSLILNRDIKETDNTDLAESIFFQMPVSEESTDISASKRKLNIYQDSILLKVYYDDQNARVKYENLKGQQVPLKNIKQEIQDWDRTDSVNLYIVENLIRENKGWISNDSVSVFASQGQFLVIQHASLEIQLKYINMITEATKAKNESTANLALLKDRILVRQNKKQIYGTQFFDDKDGRAKRYPIRNKWNVNKRRKKMGLDSL